MNTRRLDHIARRVCYTASGLLILALTSGCSLVGISNVEEAAYTVVIEDDNFELRDYEPMVIVETTVDDDFDNAGNKAFHRLFAYISGNNVANSEIAMTAPVIADQAAASPGTDIAMTAPVLQEYSQGGWRYAFVLPADSTLETAPKPLDDKVRLAQVPAKKVAVVQFSGFSSEERMQDKTSELNGWISANELTPLSEPRWAGYNPPWTIPFLRRNEVMIDVQ
ncbi:MAG: heme-binding protein [Gammaproteobacteria bacterium]|nr:heme-binding protein [Gammaproteobacteria bacterium]